MKPHLTTPNLLEAQRLTQADSVLKASGRSALLERARAELKFIHAQIADPKAWPSARINRTRAADILAELIAEVEQRP